MCKMSISVLFFVSVVTSPAVTRVTQTEIPSSCSGGDREQYTCRDGTCLDLEHVCDGVNDCLDGSDESSCGDPFPRDIQHSGEEVYRYRRQSECRRNQWQCRDGTCIPFDGKCDGAVDCPDRSDETHALCRKMACQPNWFRCTYGACVDGTAPCNTVTECADNSDELMPRCRNETMEKGGKFKCRDGTSITAFDHCDGTPNCPDGSDETVAACADKTCPAYLFQCAYGACVDRGADCNGVQDCADGSDESDELCNRIGGPVTQPTPKPGACVLPPYPDHGKYEVANLPHAKPGQAFENFVLTVSCQRGYGLLEPDGGTDSNGTQTVYCLSGVMYQDMPQCVQFCRLDPDPSVRFMCQIPETNGFKTCKDYVAPGTNVNPVCNTPNYYSSEILRYMKCIAGSWDYIAQCKPGLAKNGTNITILIKDKVEVYISEFIYVNGNNNNDKNNVNIASNSNSFNNLYRPDNSNGFTINLNNNAQGNKEISTINPLDYEISEDDWRMAPVQKKNKNKSDVNLNIYNSSVVVQSSDKINFRDRF